MTKMDALISRIEACRACEAHLPLGPRPIVRLSSTSRILIVGQAPGTKVHQSGIPWDDPSGRLLRKWLGVDEATFYDSSRIALMPMGFCYPGKGKSGDLPPRPECQPLWHESILKKMPQIQLTLLIGQYAQSHYLGEKAQKTLTENVRDFKRHLPELLPLPHPSPRNRFWLTRNPWFEEQVLPELARHVKIALPAPAQ